VAAALAVLAGCGGGGDQSTGTVAATTTTATSSTAVQSGSTSLAPLTTTTSSKSTSNEEQSGDEVPISTQALFTGRGGKITPGKIEVPPFIAVTVVLKSADGKTYSIQAKNHGIATNGTARLKLAGLRAGDRYVIKNNSGTPARLIIEANAEPGP
jgi:ABC-type phosphate transport system substrate-binding protein